MKLIKKLPSFAIAMLIASTICTPALGFGSANVLLPGNQKWSVILSDSHSSGYSYAAAKCIDVYPESGIDLYSTIQYNICNARGTSISTSSYVKRITEGDGYVDCQIKDEYLNATEIGFHFRGNTTASAYADVEYEADYR